MEEKEEKKATAVLNHLISIQIASDIHLEFPNVYQRMKRIRANAPILALLGDIGYPSTNVYQIFIEEMSKIFKYVLIIAGNHEYYSNEIYETHSILRQIDAQYKNVIFLQKQSIELDEFPGIKILGCTLWVKYYGSLQKKAKKWINDFQCIEINETKYNQLYKNVIEKNKTEIKNKSMFDKTINFLFGKKKDKKTQTQNDIILSDEFQLKPISIRKLSPLDINNIYMDHLKWIIEETKIAKDENKKVIVLTHHAPTSYLSIQPTDRYIDDISYFMNFTSLEFLFDMPIMLWCFGHTHYNTDFLVESDDKEWITRICSNPQGYYMENEGKFESDKYDPCKVITVSDDKIIYNDMHIIRIAKNVLMEKSINDSIRLKQYQ
eukprot:366790_1